MKKTLKGKREIVIRLLNGNTMTVWADSLERPYAHIKGRIAPQAKERTRYYCLTDHNKNVTGLADGNGTIRATWDYDAFGNCISQSGDMAEWNPVKYSSEYHDKELDLIYYNYRHYNPKDGRWISRDLIEEKGGYNLYSYLENMMGYFDINGNISSRLIGEPNMGINGEFKIHWSFQLDKPAKETVHIVQKIERKTKITNRTGIIVIDKVDRYWEVWKLEKGYKNFEGRNLIFNQWNVAADDDWTQPATDPGTCGTIVMTGTIGVYSQKRTENITEDWKSKRHEQSGFLPSTINEPLWWGNPGSNEEKFAINQIIVTWGNGIGDTKTNLASLTQTRKY